MVVAKNKYGKVITLVGTDAEVAQALSDQQVPLGKIISVHYNGANITAMYIAV